MLQNISIERATASDSREIWGWRNDPETRAQSVTGDEISWESHSLWFGKVLADPRRVLFIGVWNGQKVGMCRFDPHAEGAEVSINLNPAFRGKGLSKPLLAESIRKLRSEGRRMKLLATVKSTNAASIKCFTGCGFKVSSENAGLILYTLD